MQGGYVNEDSKNVQMSLQLFSNNAVENLENKVVNGSESALGDAHKPALSPTIERNDNKEANVK